MLPRLYARTGCERRCPPRTQRPRGAGSIGQDPHGETGSRAVIVDDGHGYRLKGHVNIAGLPPRRDDAPSGYLEQSRIRPNSLVVPSE
jgi:hypothetical protein